MSKLKKRVKKLEKIVKKLKSNQDEDLIILNGFLSSQAFTDDTPNKKIINPNI